MSKRKYRQHLDEVRQVSRLRRVEIEPPYVLVSVTSWVCGRRYQAAGIAQCSESDVFDETVGLAIARGRAEAEIAKEVAADREFKEAMSSLCMTLESIAGDAWRLDYSGQGAADGQGQAD